MRLVTIEVQPDQLDRLAIALRGTGDGADELATRLAGAPSVGSPLQAAVEGLLESHRAAATALGGELRWLAGAVSGVADSWRRLDGSLLSPRGQAPR